MLYLVPRQKKNATPEQLAKSKPGVAHLFNERRTDTYCNMLQTGGMNPHRYRLQDHMGGHRICYMCRQAAESGSTDLRGKNVR